jgi:glycosyltransferase involved in cell wall biosynthesis
MRQKTLSLIVPVGPMRDDWSNIYVCLKSSKLLHQVELIIIHQDENHSLCQDWLNQLQAFSDVTMFCTAVEGPGRARNHGISESSATWISFWDSDDFVYIDNILEKINELKNVADVLVGDFELRNARGEIYKSGSLPKSILELGLDVGLWRIIFRQASIKSIRFPDSLMAEDQVFVHRAKLGSLKMIFTTATFYQYRIGEPRSLTQNQLALRELCSSLRILLAESNTTSKVERQLLSLLIFKQFLALRYVTFANLIFMKPYFLLKVDSLRFLLFGGMIFLWTKFRH